MESNSCNYCKNSNASKKCSACKNAAYCSVECQKSDWKTHKTNCTFQKIQVCIVDCMTVTVAKYTQNDLADVQNWTKCVVPTMLGVPLMVKRLRPSSTRGNQIGVFMMVKPCDGLAPEEWTGILGVLAFARTDKKDLCENLFWHVYDYIFTLMDYYGDANRAEYIQRHKLNPGELEKFIKIRESENTMNVDAFEELAHASPNLLQEKMDLKRCSYCKGSNGTKNCSACLNALYCSVGCQKKDWSTHKVNCNFKKVKVCIVDCDCVTEAHYGPDQLSDVQNWTKSNIPNMLGIPLYFKEIGPSSKNQEPDIALLAFANQSGGKLGKLVFARSDKQDFTAQLFWQLHDYQYEIIDDFQEHKSEIIRRERLNLNAFQQFIRVQTGKTGTYTDFTIPPFPGTTILTDMKQQFHLLSLCQFSAGQKFQLVYKSSVDGCTPDEGFHDKCDGVRKTLTIIRTTEGYVFGGYTNRPWDNKDFSIYDRNAFLFSLKNKENSPLKIKCSNPECAISGSGCSGPIFGSGSDLCIYFAPDEHDNHVLCGYSILGSSYKHPKYEAGSDEANSFFSWFNVLFSRRN